MSKIILICPNCGSKEIVVWSLHEDAEDDEKIATCNDCNHSHFVTYFENIAPDEGGAA